MKVIDLLNKIANGEELPKKIKWGTHTFELWEHTYIERDRVHKDKNWNYDFSDYSDLSSGFLNEEIEILDEVEIIEEEKKIPEKLKKKKVINGSFEGKITYIYKYNEYEIGETINEIIDYLKSKGE